MPLRVFPVANGAQYSNDWHAGRTHYGNDLFAPSGTPLLAVDDGNVHYGHDPLGGNVVNLYATDGTKYYYAHLSAFEGQNRPVQAGEVIGYVGTTGNAVGTPSHVHFELHPNNGEAINPFPFLQASHVQGVPAATGSTSGISFGTLLALSAIGLITYAALRPKTARKWLGKAAPLVLITPP